MRVFCEISVYFNLYLVRNYSSGAFNTSAAAEGIRTHYDGLPVTYSALIIPVTFAV